MKVETLNIVGMGHNRRLARALADVAMSDFLRMLEYKCRWYGTKFVKVDRWHPSSRRGSSSCPTIGWHVATSESNQCIWRDWTLYTRINL